MAARVALLASALAVAGAVEVASSGASIRPHASPPGLLEVLTVDPNAAGWTTGTVKLEKGRAYTLKVSGLTHYSTGSESEDALYRYSPSPSRSALLRLETPGYTNAYSPIDAFQQPTPDQSCQPFSCKEGLPPSSSHEYTVKFYPPTTGPLEAGTFNQFAQQQICDHCYTASSRLTVAIYGTAPAPAPGAGTVKITSISGEVAVRVPGGGWEPVTPGTVLDANEELYTGVDSHAVVTFENGSTMQINELTQIIGGTLQQKGKRRDIEVQLKLGEIKATVQHETTLDTSMRIRRGTATASVRGSTMSVYYDPSSRIEIVGTLSDRAYFQPRRGAKTITIPGGKEIALTPSGVSRLAPIGRADARGGADPEKARGLVMALIERSATACRLTTVPGTNAGVTSAGKAAWLVSLAVQGKVSGTSTWTVTTGKVSAQNAVAKQIAAGC
jgi:hypothetical protein